MTGLIAQAAWRPVDDYGLEHVHVLETGMGLRIDSRLLREQEGQVYSAAYSILCTDDWRFQLLELRVSSDGIHTLKLSIDADGVWHDGEGVEHPELFGCLEIDISAIPFTNSLAIGRLKLQAGQSQDIQAAYIHLPDLTVSKMPQRYTAHGQARYTYEGLFRGFRADLAVDEHGLVLDYPETFIRLVS
ncbi:putative glycolipid-binding domain-containing protein [Hydromonas duriensis]|uniref:Glycolipid-binding protein n=1 Tax=Hydromonas duriensis TaxID=1527608 RepID=A0A4R6YAQ6_9BURK|nr:putative glycolipid-binding domain-containing protein [Hydromonas duriensis]TDR32571.1 hypothetical protein DFR44_10384 [Hydromonas duriensis]